MKSILRIGLSIGLGLLTFILGVGFIQSLVNGFLFYYIVDKGSIDGMLNRLIKAIPGVTVPPQKQSAVPGVTVPPQR